MLKHRQFRSLTSSREDMCQKMHWQDDQYIWTNFRCQYYKTFSSYYVSISSDNFTLGNLLTEYHPGRFQILLIPDMVLSNNDTYGY